MKNDKKIKWFRMLGRGRNHAVLFVDAVGQANLKHYAKKIIGVDFQAEYFRQLDGGRWISEKDHQALNDLLRRLNRKDPKFFYRAGTKLMKNCRNFLKFVDQHRKAEWADYSNRRLMDLFQKIFVNCMKIWGGVWAFGYYIYFNDIFLNEFKDSLEKKLSRKDFDKVWNYTLATEKITFMGLERLALLKLARKFLSRGKVSTALIRKHLDKFAFVGMYYYWGEGLDFVKVSEELSRLIKGGKKNIQKELGNFKIPVLNLDEFPLTAYEKGIIKSAKRISYTFNFTDETYNYYTFCFKPFFDEITKRLNISYEEFVSMRLKEIQESLAQGKMAVPRRELCERYKDNAIVFHGDKVQVISGKELKKYRKEELKKEIVPKLKEIKGVVAWRNEKKITGKTMIINSNERVGAFKSGSILVTQMTNPTYLPAMKKAKAIITDEGGLLCHAAIVARELGIPTIISTKIASKVLRDGMTVEVDADNGIIKILK